MSPLALFGSSVALGFVAWGIVTARYFWPALRNQPPADAQRPLLLLHSFRFVGLAFLVSGVVSPDLPLTFARPAAYGDLIARIVRMNGPVDRTVQYQTCARAAVPRHPRRAARMILPCTARITASSPEPRVSGARRGGSRDPRRRGRARARRPPSTKRRSWRRSSG